MWAPITDALQHMPRWRHSKCSRNTMLTTLRCTAHSHSWLLGSPLHSAPCDSMSLPLACRSSCHCPLQPESALGHRDSKTGIFLLDWKMLQLLSLPQCSSVFQAFDFPFASGRWGRAQTRWCCCHCSHVMLSRTSGQWWGSALSQSHAGASQWAPLSTHLWGLGHAQKHRWAIHSIHLRQTNWPMLNYPSLRAWFMSGVQPHSPEAAEVAAAGDTLRTHDRRNVPGWKLRLQYSLLLTRNHPAVFRFAPRECLKVLTANNVQIIDHYSRISTQIFLPVHILTHPPSTPQPQSMKVKFTEVTTVKNLILHQTFWSTLLSTQLQIWIKIAVWEINFS